MIYFIYIFFRDIQFLAADRYGQAVNRDQLDLRYRFDFERLPPRTLSVLPIEDRPQKSLCIACRKIFLPLDLI